MKYRQTGVGLVELMISLVLGLLVSALALQMFLGSRSSLSSQEALSYLQDSARYVSYRLKPLMRNVGYSGCKSIQKIKISNNLKELKDKAYDLNQPVRANKKKHGSVDYWKLTLAYADKESEIYLANSMVSQNSSLDFESGDIDVFLNKAKDKIIEKFVVINDCRTADIVTLKNNWVSGNTLETEQGPSRAYGNPDSVVSYVYPLKAWELFLADSNDQKSNKETTENIALFIDRKMSNQDFLREELVAGVIGMDISFGVDTDSDGTIDQTGVEQDVVDLNDWGAQIRRIEIALTLQTQPGVVPGGKNNGRLQRTFNMTFTPRNLQLRGKL